MVKNKGKGGKNRRRGKNDEGFKRELIFKEFGQEYGVVSKTLGGGNMLVTCFDGETRIGHIRGKMRKKVWINPGDLVLISLRDFQDGKADIVLKYTPDEGRSLKSLGEIPEATVINETEAENTDIHFEFGAEDEEDGESSEEIDVDDI